jgi:hypothetical protein
METYPLSLALVDFLPNIAFLIGAFFLVKTSYLCRGTRCARMLMAGTLLVFLGGFFKASWKLLYAANIADIQWMSQAQFILLGFGFLAMCVSVILMARKRRALAQGGPILAMAAWKIPFLFVMTLTSLGAEGILAYIAYRRKIRPAAVGFVIGVMGILAMGALASAEQTLAMQWIEETINTLGQSGFMVGSILLHRDFEVRGCEVLPGE